MQKLSVALATFNEEENIAKCLDSIKEIADEIVIVDGGSRDRTVEIAKKYGAKVLIADNPPIFHINKQKAIDMATGDWILQLDADEIVSTELREEIKIVIVKSEGDPLTRSVKRNFAQDDNDVVNGYWIPRKNWFLGKFLEKGGQYPDYTLRLYRKRKGRFPQKSVHEQAVVEGKVGYLKNPLLHYPYKNFAGYLEKWNKYNLLLVDKIKNELKDNGSIKKFMYFGGYVFLKPVHWFLNTYLRHKGFVDGWSGFVFCFFSSLRFPVSYIMYLSKEKNK